MDSSDVILVLPHQLHAAHPLVPDTDPARIVVFDEPLLFGDPDFDPGWHPLTIAWRNAAIDAWRESHGMPARIPWRGREQVPAQREALVQHLRSMGSRDAAETATLHVLDPIDDWMLQRLEGVARVAGLQLRVHDGPGFLLSDADARTTLGDRGRARMATFYQRQRRRFDVLMTSEGTPVGGRWSFDEDNRKRLPKELRGLRTPWPWPNNSDGDAPRLAFPHTRASARAWLEQFVDERLDRFGPYEDAMDPGAALLYHAAITPMLNHGLLEPREVLDLVLEQAADRGADRMPLQSVEGFVRQLIGWREYMRAAYVVHGRALRTANHWGHHRAEPRGLRAGTTGIEPVDDVARRVAELGWCHHIERLMVLGNYLFLTETSPDAVYAYFTGQFTDALDWVMVTNAYGMSQDAGGGLLTTKPYFSGSAYLRRMGWPRGAWCDTWDALYWRFIIRHADELRGNVRWAMAVRNADGFDAARRREFVTRAEAHIESIRT